MARSPDWRMLAAMSLDELTTGVAPSLAPDPGSRTAAQLVDAPCDELTVGDVMHPGVIVAAPESPLRYVARLMARHRVHTVVVIGDDEEGGVWGIVSDTDLLRAIVRGELDAHTAGAMAFTPVVTILRSDSVERAAQEMSDHAATHLVVVAAGGQPVGMISTLDLACAAAAAVDVGDGKRSGRSPQS